MERTSMKAYEAKISQWISDHTEEFLTDLEQLVSVNSVKGAPQKGKPFGEGPAAVLDAALGLAEKYGLSARNYDYRIGEARLDKGEKTLGMIAHLDVVPEGTGWSCPPFALTRREDGYLVGRGVEDNKGAAIMGLYLMRCVKELDLPFPHSIQLLLGCDEESGMSDVAHIEKVGKFADLYLVPDAGFPVCFAEKGIYEGNLVSQPITDGSLLELKGGLASNIVPDSASALLPCSGLAAAQALCQGSPVSVAQEEKGLRFTAIGVGSHAASPEQSSNAIFHLTDFLLRHQLVKGQGAQALTFVRRVLDGYQGQGLGISAEHPETGYLTCIGGMVRLQENRVWLNLNIRYCFSTDGETITKQIQSVCRENGFTLSGVHDSKGTYHRKDDPLVSSLTDIFNRLTGNQEQPYMMGGGTYARKLPNAVAFGLGMNLPGLAPCPLTKPGRGGAHQADENISLQVLLTGLKIYLLSLLEIGGREDIL